MQEERYGQRDRAYSAWHRRLSTRRFVGIDRAQLLAMIDLDAALYVDYDDRTKEPVALIETAMDVGQDHVRCDMRDGPEGDRVLVLHEVQSDWAQQARRALKSKADAADPVPARTLT